MFINASCYFWFEFIIIADKDVEKLLFIFLTITKL